MANVEKRYTRALQIAEFFMEGGHCIEDACNEFGISRTMINKEMGFLCTYGYGMELKRNQTLFILAKKALYKEAAKRRKKRG